ncbi:MAG: (d)CMP kinase [Chitinophagaceae bacterium]
MNSPKIIAIDGYSACGKSTLAKQLAKRLNYIYIDTGAVYRVITLYMIEQKIDISDQHAVQDSLSHIHIEFKNIDDEDYVFLNNKNVGESIRNMEVANKVSVVSAMSVVRNFSVELQRKMGQSRNVVMDGRDIGTVVFPKADIKFFMTADKVIRVQRRYKELQQKKPDITKEEVGKNIEERDFLDENRKDSPLKQASDAFLIDNSHLSIAQQLSMALEYINNPKEKENIIGENRFFMIVLYFVMAGGLALFLSMTTSSIIVNVLKDTTVNSVGISLLVCFFHCIVGFILFGMSIFKPTIHLLKLFKTFFLLPVVLIILYYIIKSYINSHNFINVFTTINVYYVLFMYLVTGGVAYYFIYKILGYSKAI